TASAFSTTGNHGRIAAGTVSQLYYATVDVGSADQVVQVTEALPVLPTGSAITLRTVGRWVDSSNYYEAELSIGTSGAATLSISKRVAGVGSSVTSGVSVGTHAAGNAWTVVLEVFGAAVRARAWNASTGSDGGTWQRTATDTSVTGGTSAGAGCRREAGN